MGRTSWVLVDSRLGVSMEQFHADAADLGVSSADWHVDLKRLRGGLSEGVDCVEICNGALSFTVLPTRGMNIWAGKYNGIRLGWDSPVPGPVHPMFVNESADRQRGWLRGFDEWIARCGLSWNGAPDIDRNVPLPLHGRISNIPASRVAVSVDTDEEAIRLSGQVEEKAFLGTNLCLDTVIETTFDSNSLCLRDRITNQASTPAEMELLYHCNFGRPLLGAGSRMVLPYDGMKPRDERAAQGEQRFAEYDAPLPGYEEQVFFFTMKSDEKGDTLALLRDPNGHTGAVIRWNVSELPYFTQWKNTAGEVDGYVTGFEPATGFPNSRPVEREQGRVVVLHPGQTYEATLQIEVLDTARSVHAVEAEIKAINT